MSRLRLTGLAAFGAAALLLVACGDTAEKNDYVDQVNEVQTTFQSEISELGQGLDSPDQLVAFYEEALASLRGAADELEEIAPPEDVAELHDRLVEEVQGLADLIQGAVDEIQQGGVAAVPGVVTELSAEGSRLQSEFSETIDEINQTLRG
jgi:hypothetical protein